MPIPKKIIRDGHVYYSVSDTARLLSTKNEKVRELMGPGELKWIQTQANTRLLVAAESIAAVLRQREA